MTPATVVVQPEEVAAAGAEAGIAPGLSPLAAHYVERARQQGYEEGFRAGQAEGTRDATAARHAAVAAVARQLAECASRTAIERQAVVDEVVGDAVELVLDLLATLIGPDGIAGHGGPGGVGTGEAVLGCTAVARALSLAPAGADLVVRLPVDSGLTASEIAMLAGDRDIAVEVDPSIGPGGCVVEAGSCRIDGRIESAIERVREHLAQVRGPGAAVPVR